MANTTPTPEEQEEAQRIEDDGEACLEMWQEYLADNPHSEEAQQQVEYWTDIVYILSRTI